MRVTGLAIYPTKSTRQISLDEAIISPTGFEHDRRWMLVDETGRFISQRQYPVLATVTTRIENGGLVLQKVGMKDLWVSLPDQEVPERVTVWKDDCEAFDAGEAAAQWFAQVIGIPCRLVRQSDQVGRPVDQRFSTPGDQTSFADGFPFLLTSEASLADLNSRLAEPVTMDRFRPNIVIDGLSAYEEDQWQAIQIGDVQFRVAKPCSRCVMTTVDQGRGEKTGKDPLMTLATYRRTDMGVIFGQNLIHNQPGTIKVGDKVSVIG